MNYPFNTGDLLCCGQCASNYLDNNVRVPWDDLRYIFGEIMYGGHIVEDWDRRLASAYLSKYFNESLLEGMELFPAFTTPPSSSNHRQVSSCHQILKNFGALCKGFDNTYFMAGEQYAKLLFSLLERRGRHFMHSLTFTTPPSSSNHRQVRIHSYGLRYCKTLKQEHVQECSLG